MNSPTLSKQKESLNRKLNDSRYKKWLKRLNNDTPELREKFEPKPRSQMEDIQHYAIIEKKYIDSLRVLISTNTKDMLIKNELMRDIPHMFTLNKKLIHFHKIPLNTIGLIEQAMTLGEELEKLSIACEDMDEYEYNESRNTINKILNMAAIPSFEDLYEDIIDFADELMNLASVIMPYIDQFYKKYLSYKSKFEEAHELKRVLMKKSYIEEAVINDTLYLYVLVHGSIPYNRNDLITTRSPVNVYQMLHSSPGCVFFSSDLEDKMYDKINIYRKVHQHKPQMIKEVITSLIPMMYKMNEKVKQNTILGKKRSVAYVQNYLNYHRRLPHLFQTLSGEDIINKEFSFSLSSKPLHFTRGTNIEGLKVVHSRYIEDTIDLVDYMKLTITDNYITFNMKDIFDVLPESVKNLVIIDASCQSSQHNVLKTVKNYKNATKRLK
jgi:hypothetical protein